MKKEEFVVLFFLLMLPLFYAGQSVQNEHLVRLGCTPGLGSSSNSGNAQTCSGEKSANYYYEDFLTLGWKFTVDGGVPRVFDANGGNLNAQKYPDSTNDCQYWYFQYQRAPFSVTENLPEVKEKHYVDVNGVRHCVYDPTSLYSKILTEYFGIKEGTEKPALGFPETMSTYMDPGISVDLGSSYILDDQLVEGVCQIGYEQKSSFTEDSGKTFTHCVKSTEVFEPGTYVTNSFLETYNGVQHCRNGGEENLLFHGKDNLISFCVEKKFLENEYEVLRKSSITEESCPEGLVQSSEIELKDKILKHCFAAENAISKTVKTTAKTSTYSSTGSISICPDLATGSRTTTGTACAPTAQCEATMGRGESVYYGLMYEPQLCAIGEDNGGNPVPTQTSPTEKGIAQHAKEYLSACTAKNQKPECGNEKLEEGESCDDGNNVNGDGCSADCKDESCLSILGELEVKGGIYNYAFLIVDDPRLVGYTKQTFGLIQSSPTDITLIEDAKTTLWIHKDLYKEKYSDFVKYEPEKGDIFDLRKHFPSKDWGSKNSFVISVGLKIERTKDGTKVTSISSEYKKWDDKFNKPYDTSEILLTNPTAQLTEAKEITNLNQNINVAAKSINAALKLYISFHDTYIPPSLYGMGVNGDKGGGTISNSIVNDWIQQSYLNSIDQGDINDGGKFDTEVKPKVIKALEDKVNNAMKKFPCSN